MQSTLTYGNFIFNIQNSIVIHFQFNSKFALESKQKKTTTNKHKKWFDQDEPITSWLNSPAHTPNCMSISLYWSRCCWFFFFFSRTLSSFSHLFFYYLLLQFFQLFILKIKFILRVVVVLFFFFLNGFNRIFKKTKKQTNKTCVVMLLYAFPISLSFPTYSPSPLYTLSYYLILITPRYFGTRKN